MEGKVNREKRKEGRKKDRIVRRRGREGWREVEESPGVKETDSSLPEMNTLKT